MEEKEVLTEEVQEEMEVQDTFNTDVLVNGEDCTIENQEEVSEDGNENK